MHPSGMNIVSHKIWWFLLLLQMRERERERPLLPHPQASMLEIESILDQIACASSPCALKDNTPNTTYLHVHVHDSCGSHPHCPTVTLAPPTTCPHISPLFLFPFIKNTPSSPLLHLLIIISHFPTFIHSFISHYIWIWMSLWSLKMISSLQTSAGKSPSLLWMKMKTLLPVALLSLSRFFYFLFPVHSYHHNLYI